MLDAGWKTEVMKHFFVVVLVILTGVSAVCANLGDSADRVEDSYGKIVERHLFDDGKVSVLYHKDRYLYFVIFENSRSILERYSHTKGSELSEKEIARFLKANGGKATWTRNDRSEERRFERSDGKAEATYGDFEGRPTLKVREIAQGRNRGSNSREQGAARSDGVMGGVRGSSRRIRPLADERTRLRARLEHGKQRTEDRAKRNDEAPAYAEATAGQANDPPSPRSLRTRLRLATGGGVARE
jgi:hypothetical protein